MRSEGCRGRAFTTAPRRRRTVLKCGSSSKANHSPPKPNSIRRRACRMLSTRPHEDVLCSTHQQEHSVINLRFGKSLATSDELACHCLAGSLLSRTLREGNIGFHNILPASLLNLYLSKGFGDGFLQEPNQLSRGGLRLPHNGWLAQPFTTKRNAGVVTHQSPHKDCFANYLIIVLPLKVTLLCAHK